MQLIAEEYVERCGEFAIYVVVAVDEKTLEERLIELTSHLVRRVPIGGLAVLNERERPIEVSFGRGVITRPQLSVKRLRVIDAIVTALKGTISLCIATADVVVTILGHHRSGVETYFG